MPTLESWVDDVRLVTKEEFRLLERVPHEEEYALVLRDEG